MNYKYTLQKYSGPSSRHTCPNCGAKRSFTLYVDEDGQPLDPSVGRCDHESSCGYHYTPREYFHDHPEVIPSCHPERFPSHPERFSCHSERSEESTVHPRSLVHHSAPMDKVDTLPPDIVTRSFRPYIHSDLTRYLSTLLAPLVLEGVIHEYRLGVTRSRDVIFFQIDTQGRVRTGKIMKYDSDTGHRIKDPGTPGRITWVHSLMKSAGTLPQSWTLNQCLFGEHLLGEFPDSPVALVESEKTAVICAGLFPKFVWLAIGGKSCLNDRLLVLSGRKVTAFPDIDGYDTWLAKAREYPELDITVSDLLQKYGTPEDRAGHIDIADWLIRWHRTPNPRADSTFASIAQYFSPEIHDELKALIQDLDLEVVNVESMG